MAIAELHSFAEAGNRLGITSSAVSQLVAELESVLGFRIFDRITRRVALSSAGRDFLASAESVLRHVQAAEKTADDLRNRAAGIVRVGAPPVLAGMALPAATRAYAATRPKVVVRVVDTPVDALIDHVANGDLDLAIGPNRATGAHVAGEPGFDSPWMLWCTPDHPLARRRRVRWSDLRDTPLAAAGRDHERSVAQMRLSAPADARITPIDVVDNVTSALGVAARGLAATLTPGYVAALAHPFGLVMRRVVAPETIRQLCVYRPLSRAASPAAEGFAQFLPEWLPQWNESIMATPQA